ncbi:hypothetical protein BJ944DRAFT_181816 [Cunninghamella echinulata]|nr:hypothetical protein BJ944DRAFT_181816 [Cunninghamella echinulata]
MSTNQDIVLHYYNLSPFANKIAWILNYKKVNYKLVNISIQEPRPNRRYLDGGYTKTPILQIGNQVYCDTKTIIAELEARFPEPSLYPKKNSRLLSIGMNYLLENAVFVAIPTQFPLDALPKAFLEDRAKFAGRELNIEKQKAMQPYLKLDLEAQLERVVKGMVHNNNGNDLWLLDTETPTDADFTLAMDTFFAINILGHDYMSDRFPILVNHYERLMKVAADPGRVNDMVEISDVDALVIAKEQQSSISPSITFAGKQELFSIGQKVAVTPLDTGKTPAVGELVALSPERVTIKISNERTGDVYVHFPITTFIITPVVSRL